jgi:Ala-tRNA(Pro) deacylase
MDAESRLYARFAEMGITYDLVEHEPTARVEDSRDMAASMPGGRSKSLLLTDKDGRLVLATLLGEQKADLRKIGDLAGTRGRLSFASPELMQQTLGVGPGHLSPFALINDIAGRVGTTLLDERLLSHSPVWAHPLRNTASVGLKAQDLEAFVRLHADRCEIAGLAAS